MSQCARVAMWVPTANPPDSVNDNIQTNTAPTALGVIATRFTAAATGGSGGGISEAPIDGTPYARQDAGWVASAAAVPPLLDGGTF
jgi:hypothetical protein